MSSSVFNSTVAVERSHCGHRGWEGFTGEGNAEDIFGAAQSGLGMAVNGYARMLPPQHNACSAMRAIKTCISSF